MPADVLLAHCWASLLVSQNAWLLSDGGGALCMSPLHFDSNMCFGISWIIQSGSRLRCIAQWHTIGTLCNDKSRLDRWYLSGRSAGASNEKLSKRSNVYIWLYLLNMPAHANNDCFMFALKWPGQMQITWKMKDWSVTEI